MSHSSLPPCPLWPCYYEPISTWAKLAAEGALDLSQQCPRIPLPWISLLQRQLVPLPIYPPKASSTETSSPSVTSSTSSTILSLFNVHQIRIQVQFNLAARFNEFHSLMSAFVKIKEKEETGPFIDLLLTMHSFQIRDILARAYAEIQRIWKEPEVPFEFFALFNCIQLFDLCYIVFIYESSTVASSFVCWFKTFCEVGNEFELQNCLDVEIKNFVDGKTASTCKLSELLARLLCRVNFKSWSNSVKRIFFYDEQLYQFAEDVEEIVLPLGNFETSISNNTRISIRHKLHELTKNLLLRMDISEKHVLFQSLKILQGHDWTLKGVDCSWIESLASHCFWMPEKRSLSLANQWLTFMYCSEMDFEGRTLNVMEHLLLLILKNNSASSMINLIEDQPTISLQFGLFWNNLYAHLVDLLYISGNLECLTGFTGAEYRAKLLCSYAMSLRSTELQCYADIYFSETQRYVADSNIISNTIKNFLTQNGNNFNEFQEFIGWIFAMNASVSTQTLNNIIFEACKLAANDCIGNNDVYNAIRFSLLHDRLLIDSCKKEPIQMFSESLLYRISAEGPKQSFLVLELFHNKLDEFEKIRQQAFHGKVYQFYQSICPILLFVKSLEFISLDAEKNVAHIRQCIKEKYHNSQALIHQLLTFPGQLECFVLKKNTVPLALIPLILEKCFFTLYTLKKYGLDYLINSEDENNLRRTWRNCLDRAELEFPDLAWSKDQIKHCCQILMLPPHALNIDSFYMKSKDTIVDHSFTMFN